jgi:GPH family glycoside/pentoside/hexuronide:cation symporter
MDRKPTQGLPLSQALIYASGYFGVRLISFASGQIPQIFYIPEEGMARIAAISIGGAILLGGYLFGFVNFVGRVVDAFVDPIIGNRSDYFRSRFGRRKPFLVVGAPLMGLLMVLFTLAPTRDPSVLNFFWLLIIYPAFFIFFSVAITPYLAMIPELTSTPANRLLVTTLQAVFLVLGNVAGILIVGQIPHVLSFPVGTAIIALLACIPFFLVAAFVRTPNEPAMEDIPDRPSTFSQVRDALNFKPFRIFLIGQVSFWFGFTMIESSARYVAVHLFGNQSAFVIMLGTALAVGTVAGPLSYWIGRRFGKKRAMVLMSAMFIVLFPFVGLIGLGPLSSPIAGYIVFGLLGFPLSLLLVIPNSLLADIIDRDEETTGKKRQALFFAAQSLLDKTGMALSLMMLNLLLPIGAVATSEGTRAVGEAGVRLVGPFAAVFVFIGLFFFMRLPDVEKR